MIVTKVRSDVYGIIYTVMITVNSRYEEVKLMVFLGKHFTETVFEKRGSYSLRMEYEETYSCVRSMVGLSCEGQSSDESH